MSAQPLTFHHFPLLPAELRIHILTLASMPDKRPSLHTTPLFSTAFRYHLSIYRPADCTVTAAAPFFHTLHKCTRYGEYSTRAALLGTSRLARKIALVAWKRDVMELSGRWNEGEVEEARKEMVRCVEGLIEDVDKRLDREWEMECMRLRNYPRFMKL